MPKGRWFYMMAGQQYGPVTIDILRGMLAEGAIDPTDLAWREDMPEWVRVSEIEELGGMKNSHSRNSDAATVLPHDRRVKYISRSTNASWLIVGAIGCLVGIGALCASSRTFLPPKRMGPIDEAISAERQRRLYGKFETDEDLTRLPERSFNEAAGWTGNGLDLSGSRVTDAGMALLKHSKHIIPRLNLQNTAVGDAGMQPLADLPLRRLNLAGTAVGDAGMLPLAGLPLTHLNLARTAVSNKGIATLAAAINGVAGTLHYLDLSGTRVTDEGLQSLKHMKLRELDLADTAVGDVGMRSLAGYELRRLNLAGTAVGDAGMPLLAGLCLTDLNLARTAVGNEGIATLPAASRRCSDLAMLDLSGTRVSDEGLQSLRAIHGLKRVKLEGTAVSEEAVKLLRDELPGCEIVK